MNQALLARMRFIDFLLQHYGWVNRVMICDYFGLSVPQASTDIQKYVELYPTNIVYDKRERRYVKAVGYERKLP